MSKFKLILLILGIICFIINIFFVIFYRHYYSSEAVKILFYISFGLIYLVYLFMLFMDLPIRNKTINKFRRKCRSPCGVCIIFIILILIYLFELIILSFMIVYNMNFWINCPFTITDNFNLHYKRRCELYNINNNSRYLNQYICSYDPYDDFKNEYNDKFNMPKKLKKKIKSDYVRCVKLKNLIPDNKIIALFNNEYKDIDKYYCSRTNRPKKNFLINDKDCDNKVKHIFFYILYGFNFLKLFFIGFFLCYILRNKSDFDYDAYRYDRNYNIRNNNNRNNNNIANNSNNNNNNLDNTNNEINSTKISEDINKNNISSIGIVNQETKSIIIENKKEIPFEDKFRDYPYDSEIDIKNDSLGISKISSPDIKNNEVQKDIHCRAKDENQKQGQGGNTSLDDEGHGGKN